jgi:hypothetical protein
MAFIDAHDMLTFPQLLYLCGIWTVSQRSANLVAPIEEQPPIDKDLSTKLVHWNPSADAVCGKV